MTYHPFLDLYVLYCISYYLFPLPIADCKRCLPRQLYIIVIIFLLPTSCIYRRFRATFTIKSFTQFFTLQSLQLWARIAPPTNQSITSFKKSLLLPPLQYLKLLHLLNEQTIDLS